jgi:hypothetical protein
MSGADVETAAMASARRSCGTGATEVRTVRLTIKTRLTG